MSYVGVLENVAGFNVFFQVNCKMPMDALRSFLPGVPLRVGRSTRTEPWRLLESQEVSVFSWRWGFFFFFVCVGQVLANSPR
jgi:hypothetical protein